MTNWVGDVVYLVAEVGWLYLPVIPALSSRRVAGDALNRRKCTQLALAALKAAIKCRTLPFNLLHCMDQGSPCVQRQDHVALETCAIVCCTR